MRIGRAIRGAECLGADRGLPVLVDEMKHPPFATILEGAFMRLKSGDQIDMVEAAQDLGLDLGPGYGVNPAARWRQILKAKAAYGIHKGLKADEVFAAQPKRGASLCAITATEANEALAAMPPVPLAGE
jgi:hypothetical protein